MRRLIALLLLVFSTAAAAAPLTLSEASGSFFVGGRHSPIPPLTLAERTTAQTAPDGAMQLRADGMVLNLLAGSELQIRSDALRLEGGSVELHAATMRLNTPLARLALSDFDGRIDYVAALGTLNISVFAGSIAAWHEGRRIVLGPSKRLFISRKSGRRVGTVESAPSFKDLRPLTRVGDAPVQLRWQDVGAPVEVTLRRVGSSLPLRVWRSRFQGTPVPALSPGMYELSLRRVDRGGGVGHQGPARLLAVLPPSRGAEDQALTTIGDTVELPGPGTLTQPAPEGARIRLGDQGRTVRISRPGRHEVPYKLYAGDHQVEGLIQVLVGLPKVRFEPPRPVLRDGFAHTTIRFVVRDVDNRPVDGLKFVATRLPAGTPAAAYSGQFEVCDCKAPAARVLVHDDGGGDYSFDISSVAAEARVDSVEIRSMESGIRYVIPVKIGASGANRSRVEGAVPPAPEGRVRALIAARVGGQTSFEDDLHTSFLAGAEVGIRVGLSSLVALDISAEVATVERRLALRDGTLFSVGVYPLQLRAASVFDVSWFKPYAGASGGVAFVQLPDDDRIGRVSNDPQLIWSVFAGGGFVAGPGEVVAELSYGARDHGGQGIEGALGGFGFTVGYKLLPGWY